MAENNQKLFNDFSTVSTKEWEEKIDIDLKGKDYEKALIWRTHEGFSVKPYYREENIKELGYIDTLPGEFPFIRGTKNNNDWKIRQDIFVQDFEKANKKALSILKKGVNSLGFYFDCCTNVSKDDLEVLFNGIFLDACEVNFVCPCEKCNCIDVFVKYIEENKLDKNLINASSSVDPIGSFILKGKFENGLEQKAFDKLKENILRTLSLPGFKVIGVHGKFFGNSGSSIVQELAFSLAEGTEYLIRLTDIGLKVDDVAKKIKFNFSISGNYFMEIGKLRAARLLWAHIVKAFNPKDTDISKIVIHCETASINKTIYDPYVNMLRTQTEAMSAVLGGADSLTVQGYDSVYNLASDFSERIARNQQLLLKEESNFDKVVDPGAGSYYIETLTDSIANESWKLFLEIQDRGGFISALREGFIQNEIKSISSIRDKNYALRKENLLGTNQFPNFSEIIENEFDDSSFEKQDFTLPESEVETLKPYRFAQTFERIRKKTDSYSKEHKRPVVFMLTIGNLAMRKARAQFSCNFFAVAGFKVIDNDGFDSIEKGLHAAEKAKADIVVLCSSDEEYAGFAPEAAEKMDNSILVIAANPACRTELEEKGIANYIHVRSNVLDELKKYQDILGIR